MENLDPVQIWLLMAAIAGVAFIAGRASAGGNSLDNAEEQMRRRQESERLFASLPPEVQQDVDDRIQRRKTVEAIKIVQEHSGVGLKEAKQAIDERRAAMGAI